MSAAPDPELLKEPVAKVIEFFIANRVAEPHFEHRLSYPKLTESVSDLSDGEARRILDRLAAAGIVKKEVVDRAVLCPSCDGENLLVRVSCAICGALDVSQGGLIEHLPCGSIAQQAHFLSEKGWFCSKCKKSIELPKDARRVGVYWRCEKCNKKFESPSVKYACKRCSKDYSLSEVSLADIVRYVMTEQSEAQAKRVRLFSALMDHLQQRYHVELGVKIRDPAGGELEFDLGVFDKSASNKILKTVDVIVGSGPLKVQDIAPNLAKVGASRVGEAWAVAVPGVDQQTRQVAMAAGLRIVDQDSFREIL